VTRWERAAAAMVGGMIGGALVVIVYALAGGCP